MTIDTDKLTANWKTTANGLLSAGVAVVIAWMALPAGSRRLVYALAALRALVGFTQTDAGTTLAITPAGDVRPVASHETPDDSADVAVTK